MATSDAGKRNLGGDEIDAFRPRLRARLSGDASVGAAVDSVLGELSRLWEDSYGLDPDSYRLLQDELGPPLDALEAVPPRDAKPAADQLVERWRRIRDQMKWL
jgi:hypothetical protein